MGLFTDEGAESNRRQDLVAETTPNQELHGKIRNARSVENSVFVVSAKVVGGQ